MEHYHFVVKDSKSASLSQGDKEEAYRIRCHSQTRRRRGARSTAPSKQHASATAIPDESHRTNGSCIRSETSLLHHHSRISEELPAIDHHSCQSPTLSFVPSHWAHYVRRVPTVGSLHHLKFTSLSTQPRGNSIDPFTSTSMIQHPSAYQLVQFLQSDFNHFNFQAEAWQRPSTVMLRACAFRHKAALSERMRNSMQDDMLMLSTLAYASGAIGWRFGVFHADLPPAYFIQRTYRCIRERLQKSQEVEENLLWSIYGLAAAEMWVRNFDAAAAHMRVLQTLISQLGGLRKLTPFIMETIILGAK
jgi:hypothetical protein